MGRAKASRVFRLVRGQASPAPAVPSPDQTVETSDLALIRKTAEGDREAFETLYRRFYPRLYRYLVRLMRGEEMVEDILNEVMLVVWQRAGSFEERSRPSTWILGIAYNKGLKAIRRRSNERLTLLPDTLEDIEDEIPVDDVSRRQLSLDLESAMESLSPEQRSVVELTYVYGFSYREISQITGAPENTVKTRMFYARKRLREAWPGGDLRPGAGTEQGDAS